MRDTATMVNGFDMNSVDALDPELRRIVERRASLLGPAYKLFYANPVRIVRGEGVHLYDADGQAYLDAYNNVPSVGHCHPRVVEAIARQAATLNTHTRYAERADPRLRGAAARHVPGRLSATSCSPAPAARRSTWRCASRASTPAARAIVITANAYHGVTRPPPRSRPASARRSRWAVRSGRSRHRDPATPASHWPNGYGWRSPT